MPIHAKVSYLGFIEVEYRGYIGIREKNIETTIVSYIGIRV